MSVRYNEYGQRLTKKGEVDKRYKTTTKALGVAYIEQGMRLLNVQSPVVVNKKPETGYSTFAKKWTTKALKEKLGVDFTGDPKGRSQYVAKLWDLQKNAHSKS